jgi:hypothetical protein
MAENEVVEIPAEMDSHDAAALLDKITAEPEPKKGPAKDPATGKFVKAKAPETPEGSEEEPEAEEAEVEEEEPETLAEAEVRKLKVKLDGMEQEVPEEEVVRGYQRQADYTKKTQELAETRKRFEAEELAPVREERRYYAENLQRLTEALEAIAPSQEPDWESLAHQLTPEDFSKQFTGWKANRDRVEKVQAEHARVLALHEQQESRDRAARLRQEQEKLEAAIPELKDPEKGKGLREDLMAYANSIGFTDDELGGVEDHRALVILNKARLYDESLKRRPTVEAKVEKAIAGMKPSGSAPKPRAKEAEMLRTKLKSGGSVDDAARLLDTLMG